MPTTNEDILDRIIRHTSFIERLKVGKVRDVVGLFNRELVPEIITSIRTILEDVSTINQARRKSVLTTRVINKAYIKMLKSLEKSLIEFGVSEAGFQQRLLTSQAGRFGLNFTSITASTVRSIVETDAIRGALLKKWFDGARQSTINAVQQEITLGFAEGKSIDQMVSSIRGTRGLNFSDGILNKSRHNLSAITRTAVNQVSNNVRERTYDKNNEVIKGVMYVATLDSRTTVICASFDGQVFPINEGPRPPQHINCRSTTTPVLKSWKELGIDLKEAPPGTRASMNGQVPAKQTYPQWLAKQNATLQNKVLGVRKGRAFRKGELSIKQMVDQNNRPLTLVELEMLDRI